MDQSLQQEGNGKLSVNPLNPLLEMVEEKAISVEHGLQQNLELPEMSILSSPTEVVHHEESAMSVKRGQQQNPEGSEISVLSNPTEVMPYEERTMSLEHEQQQSLEGSEFPLSSNTTEVMHYDETAMSVEHGHQENMEGSEIPLLSSPVEVMYQVREEQYIEQQLTEKADPLLPLTDQQEMEITEQLPSQIAQAERCQPSLLTRDQQEIKVCEPLSQTPNQEVVDSNHSCLQEAQPIGEQQSDSLSVHEDCVEVETVAPQGQSKVAVSAAHHNDEVEDKNKNETLQYCGKHQQEDSQVFSVVTNKCENQIMVTSVLGDVHCQVNGSSKQEMVKQPEGQTLMKNFPHVEDKTKVFQTDVQENHKHDQEKTKDHQKKQNGLLDKPKANSSDKSQSGQKQEQQTKKQKTAVVGENYERINYLVQASRGLVSSGISNEEQGSLEFDRALASQTGSLAAAVGRRCLIRLTPSLKRMMCKGCGTSLIYGVNARVRRRSNRQGHLVITCFTCSTIKRIVCDPKHQLWCDKEEALL